MRQRCKGEPERAAQPQHSRCASVRDPILASSLSETGIGEQKRVPLLISHNADALETSAQVVLPYLLLPEGNTRED